MIVEPRKAKASSRRERRATPAPPDEERESPSSRAPSTLPSTPLVLMKPPATPLPPAAAGVARAAVQVRSSAADEPAAGDLLADRYRLIERIGMGGMGAVWRARSAQLDLDVAVKLIRPNCAVPDARERLLREARLAARIVHSGTVRIFDCGVTAAGDPFLVMELLDGKSLSRILVDKGPMSPVAAVQLMLPILGALSVAHRQGVVHRDIKPSNILLIEDGRRVTPKLIDFGIACNAPGSGARRLTAHDLALGSLDYMAPEQLEKGGEPDQRTDVWGVCSTLFELVSGAKHSQGNDPFSRLMSLKPGQPHGSSGPAEYPRFCSIVARGLSRSSEGRWPTMSALGSVLAEWALRAGARWDVTHASLELYCNDLGDLPA